MDRDVTLHLAPSPAVGIATCSPAHQIALCTGSKIHIVVPKPEQSSKTAYSISEVDLEDGSASRPEEVSCRENLPLTEACKRRDGGNVAAWNRTGVCGGSGRMVSPRPFKDAWLCAGSVEFASRCVPLGELW